MFSCLTDAGKGWYQILHVGCYNEPAVPGKGQLKNIFSDYCFISCVAQTNSKLKNACWQTYGQLCKQVGQNGGKNLEMPLLTQSSHKNRPMNLCLYFLETN